MSCVLAIDDEPDLLQLMEDFLTDAGYRVLACRSVREAIDLLSRDGKVDLILSDIFMPDADGLELLRAVHRQMRPIPVVLMSGRVVPRFDPLQAGRKLGAAAVLNKPLDLDELLSTVDRVMGSYNRQVASDHNRETLFS